MLRHDFQGRSHSAQPYKPKTLPRVQDSRMRIPLASHRTSLETAALLHKARKAIQEAEVRSASQGRVGISAWMLSLKLQSHQPNFHVPALRKPYNGCGLGS